MRLRPGVAGVLSAALLVVVGCEVPDPGPEQRIRFPQERIPKTFDDVPYGDAPSQRLDLYLPERRNGGVVVWLHGGGWADQGEAVDTLATEEQTGMQPIVQALYRRGWTIASVGYTDASVAPLPQQEFDAKIAIRWVRRHAALFGLSSSAVVAMGWSAGGHLAVLAGTSAGELEPTDVPPTLLGVSSRPDAVVSIQGVLDPLTFADTSGVYGSNPAAMAAALGCPGRPTEWRTCDPERLASVVPAAYLDAGDPPVYIVASDLDGIVDLTSQALVPYSAFVDVLGPARVLLDVVDTGSPDDHDGLDPRNHTIAVSYELHASALLEFLGPLLPARHVGAGGAGGGTCRVW